MSHSTFFGMKNMIPDVFMLLSLCINIIDGIGQDIASYLIFKLFESASVVTWTIL